MAYLRLKNIMGGVDEEDAPNDMANSFDDGMYGGDGDIGQPSNNPLPSMSDLYKPSNVANGALTSHLNAMPNRDDFHASIGRKVLAGIAGLGAGVGPAGISGGSPIGFRGNSEAAFKTANGIVNQPYNQAVDDWDNKLKPLEVNAKLEDNDNTNNRIAANNTMSRAISDKNATTRQEDEKRKARNDDETARHHQANEEAARKRIEAKEFANTHPKMKSFTGKDGYIYFYDPADKNGKGIKTDILSKDMNDFDKLQMRHNNAISEIDERANKSGELEDKKQKGRIEVKTTAAPAKPVSLGVDVDETTETTIGPDGKSRITKHHKGTTPKPVTGTKPDNQPNNQVEDVTKVPKEKRVIGKNYRLANGTIGRWVGTGFTAVQ